MTHNRRNNQPSGEIPPNTGRKLTCADILRNNVREALLRDFEQHYAYWPLDEFDWANPDQIVATPAKTLWQTATVNVRFELSFVPKPGVAQPADIGDYTPVFKVTGSKLVASPAQPADDQQGQ